jgi:hypothetical protein
MARILLVLKLLGLAYLTYLAYVLAFEYDPASPSFRPPFILWIVNTINLFIHEGGHFFMRPFGQWIYVFGGSFVQVLLPLLLALLGLRQNYRYTILPAFWCGENMVEVSVYIRDAPFRHLKLIARGVIHDWNWLLSDNLDIAESLADIVQWTGILLCLASIGVGVYAAIRMSREALLEEMEEALPARIGNLKSSENQE